MAVKRMMAVLLYGLGIALSAAGTANATLIDMGDGTVYDDVSKLMWLKDVSTASTHTFGVAGIAPSGYMNWFTAQDWIAAMNAANYLGYHDWRLPHVLPVNGQAFVSGQSYDGSTDIAYNISALGSAHPGTLASELAYMFYVNWGAVAPYDVFGNYPQPGYVFGPLPNVGPFTGFDVIGRASFWTGTGFDEFNAEPKVSAYIFSTQSGQQNAVLKDGYELYAWAVREVTVPEPATFALLGLGLAGLGFSRRKQ